jgi:ribosome biogenesis GTPase
VIKSTNSFYSVQTQNHVFACKVRGRMKKSRYSVCVGDHVIFQQTNAEEGVIEEVVPRTSLMQRPEVANVDLAVVVFAAARPDMDLGLMDRFLVVAEMSGIPAALCINKIDMVDNMELALKAEPYVKIGYPVILTSALTGAGIRELQDLLYGKLSVFAGPSGVGKSSLLNAVELGLALSTGELSEKIGRGKHTTRCAELLPLSGGGHVVDTPGFSLTEF